MSSRQAFLNCIEAKATAQLNTAKDKITDPAKAEQLKYTKNMTATKLREYQQALSEILDDEASTPELRAQAKAAVDGLIDTYQIKAAGKARSMLMGQKGANFVKEVAKRAWGPEDGVKGLFWSAPHLRGSTIDAAAQVLSLEDLYNSHSSAMYGRLHKAVSIMNDEAKMFFHTQNKDVADSVFKDMFAAVNGEPRSTNVKVREAADALLNYDKDMVTELRSRGVPIPEGGRKNYVAGRVMHNSQRLSRIPEAMYVEEMTKLYNNGGLNKDLIDAAVGGTMTPAKLEIAFKSIYHAETGQALDSVPKALGSRVASLHKTKEMHRLLEFTNYDAMKEFDGKFGFDNNFEKFQSLIERNARTLASLDTFGADRAASAAQMKNAAIKYYGARGGEIFDREYTLALKHFGVGFKNSLDPTTASNISGVKSLTASTLLGKHPVGALTTDWAINLPRTMATMGRGYLTPFYEGIKNISARLSGNYADRLEVLRMLGGEMQNMMADMQGSIRATNATGAAKLGGSAYKMVEVGSLNRLMTKVNRRLAATTFANTLGEHIETGGKFGDSSTIMGSLLHNSPKKATFSKFLEGFGVHTDDIIKMKPYLNSKGGLKYIDADKIPVGDNEIRHIFQKLLAAQADLIERSSPTSSARFSAALAEMKSGGPLRAGFIEFHSLFMGYAMSMLHRNVLPILKAEGGKFSKVRAAAAYSTMLVTAGVMTEWIYDLIKGRDPQPVSPQLMLKGMMRAGVGGPAMDYIGAFFMPGRTNQNLIDSPIVGKVEDAIKAGVKIAKGKEGGVSDAVKVAGELMPGSSLWWMETIYKQGILHHLREVADPEGTRAADRRRAQNAKKSGTEYFVEPGLNVKRAPNLENITPKG